MENITRKVPVEILFKTFRLVLSPRTREGVYALLELTHVCRFWRAALVNQPHMWSTIFATQYNRRNFIEMCLERSQAVALDVTVDASKRVRAHKECTCDKDERRRLLPNENIPCEWHFTFELLATPEHSGRIRTLNIDFRGGSYYDPIPRVETSELALGACRFFSLSFPQLTTLGWADPGTDDVGYIFSISPFTPTLRRLSLSGYWDGVLTQLSNLTSFTFEYDDDWISAEAFRLFMSNNRSLESLSLDVFGFEDDSKGPPIDLLNLKSLSVSSCSHILSTIIRVPALQHLSSLRITLDGFVDGITLDATGDRITLSVETTLRNVAGAWQDLAGYTRPVIRHVRFCDYPEPARSYSGSSRGRVVIPLLADAHTLEVGRDYLPFFYATFLDDLKQLGPQLKIIRFEVWQEMEPCRDGDEYEAWGGNALDQIEDLVKYRFEQGRPFAVVERMVVSENERSNRLQDHVWRCFYGSRKLSQYVLPA